MDIDREIDILLEGLLSGMTEKHDRMVIDSTIREVYRILKAKSGKFNDIKVIVTSSGKWLIITIHGYGAGKGGKLLKVIKKECFNSKAAATEIKKLGSNIDKYREYLGRE